jgi:epoxyqueuosine reductase
MERQQRQDLRLVFPGVRSVISAGMLYNSPFPKSIDSPDPSRGWISRYGWGDDYHDLLHSRLEELLTELRASVAEPFEARVYTDTAPLLERAIARAAGLGWIGKNTCLIDQKAGSWFLVGEILTSLELPPDTPPPDRCGTCTRCIDACPTAAIVEPGKLDATRCIAYFTIEARGAVPEEFRPAIGRHVFGCDICQDVCPWNRKAPVTREPAFQPRRFQRTAEAGSQESEVRTQNEHTAFNPPLEWLASLSEAEFSALFRKSPVKRAKYRGMLRNVATAMGNSGDERYRAILEKLAEYPDEAVQEHARWAVGQRILHRNSDKFWP